MTNIKPHKTTKNLSIPEIALIVIFVLISFTFFYFGLQGQDQEQGQEQDQEIVKCSYMISSDGTDVYATNCKTGIIEYSESDGGSVIDYALSASGDTPNIIISDTINIASKVYVPSNTRIEFDNTVLNIITKGIVIFETINTNNVTIDGRVNINTNDNVIFSQIDSENIKWIADTTVYGSGHPLFLGWKGNLIEIGNINAINFNGNAVFMNAGNDIYIHDINLDLIGTFPESDDALIFVHSNQPETISNWRIEDITIDGTNSGDEKAVAVAVNGNRAPVWGHDVSIKNIYIENYYMDGLDVINLYNTSVDNFNYRNGVVGGIFVCSDKTVISNSLVDNGGTGFVFGDCGCPDRSYSDFKLINSEVRNSNHGFAASPSEGTIVSDITIDGFKENGNEYSIYMGADTLYTYTLGDTYNVLIKNSVLTSPTYFGDKVHNIEITATEHSTFQAFLKPFFS